MKAIYEFQKIILYKMVYFLFFYVIAMWQLTWPDHFSDFETFLPYDFFSMMHIHFFNLKKYWNMFWKALDPGYLVNTMHAEETRIFRVQIQNKSCQICNVKFMTKNENPVNVMECRRHHKLALEQDGGKNLLHKASCRVVYFGCKHQRKVEK